MTDSPTLTSSSPGTVTFRIVAASDDHTEVMGIRDAVYVREHGYLDSATDIAATFDVFDSRAAAWTYFLTPGKKFTA